MAKLRSERPVIAKLFQYCTGQTNYTFELPEQGFLNVEIAADEPCVLLLIHTDVADRVYPWNIGSHFSRKVAIDGFNMLSVVPKSKKTRVAVKVEVSTKASLDPLDYTPVKIDMASSDTEQIMMRQAIDSRLQQMGIDPHQYEGDGTDEDDLEFIDDEGFETDAITAFTEMAPASTEEGEKGEPKAPTDDDAPDKGEPPVAETEAGDQPEDVQKED